jgi:hypothetical protein
MLQQLLRWGQSPPTLFLLLGCLFSAALQMASRLA